MSSDRFDWKATESAPSNYPMRIINGTLLYRGESHGLYIPSGGTIDRGWGEMVSSHIVGPDLKPLPDRLDIKFFSYTENQFYHGKFELPYDDIRRLFKEWDRLNDRPAYNRIMTGVAPGGAVAVWLTGQVKTTEVFFGKAEPVEGEIEIFGRALPNHDEHVQKTLSRLIEPQVLHDIKQHGPPVDAWVNYRKQYNWKPVFMYGSEPSSGAQTKYFNGEGDRLFFPFDDKMAAQSRPIPMFMQFRYRSSEGWAYLYVIHFDEAEMMEAFSTLGANDEPLQLEFYPHMPYQNTQIRLSNKDDSIVLKKYFIEDI